MIYLQNLKRISLCILMSLVLFQTAFAVQPVAEAFITGQDAYNYSDTPMALTSDGKQLAYITTGKIIVYNIEKRKKQDSISLPIEYKLSGTLQWDDAGIFLAFMGMNRDNYQLKVFVWNSRNKEVTFAGKTKFNVRRGGFKDRHSPTFWMPHQQKLVYLSRELKGARKDIGHSQIPPVYGPQWEATEGALEEVTDSLKIYRSFVYVQKLQGYIRKESKGRLDTLISRIFLFDPMKGKSTELFSIKELNTGGRFSLGITELLPLPDGKHLFIAYRPEELESRSNESRSGFVVTIPPSNTLNGSILDLTGEGMVPPSAEIWVHSMPFGHNNTGAWVPSNSGQKLAWIVRDNPQNLETDLSAAAYTVYIRKSNVNEPLIINLDYISNSKESACDYPSLLFKPDIKWGPKDKSLYVAAGGQLWEVNNHKGDKRLLSNGLDRIVKNLLSVTDKGVLVHTLDPRTGKNGFWWWAYNMEGWSMVKEMAKAYGNFHLAENAQNITLALCEESLSIPSNISVWTFNKTLGKIIDENHLTNAISLWKDMEHTVFTYANNGIQPGIGIIIRGKGQKGRLPVIVKSYPADPVSVNIMHYGMDDWIIDLQKAIDRGYAVMFVDTPILPGYGKVGPAKNIVQAISAAVKAAEKSGWVDTGRMGIIGHSNGGYLVNTVVAHLPIFKAAVSISGISDLVSFAMESDAGQRMVQGAGRMEVGLTEDPDRYVINSPLAADLSKVTAPLLLIHGELDPIVPVYQADEMFKALASKGKIVQLNRYVYEGHGGGGTLLKNAFEQALDWFDFHLEE